MSHFRPGPYVFLDNLSSKSRFVMNAWLSYQEDDVVDGNETFWLKYLFIYANGKSLCINLWNLDLIDTSQQMLSRNIEWDNISPFYMYDDALKESSISLNGKLGSWFDHMERMRNNKKLRDIAFADGEVKTIVNKTLFDNFELEYRLVYDENAPKSDKVWDRSECVNLRYRIFLRIYHDDIRDHNVELLLDKGVRGFPSIETKNWFPTRKMDGALISKDKAKSIEKFTYIKEI